MIPPLCSDAVHNRVKEAGKSVIYARKSNSQGTCVYVQGTKIHLITEQLSLDKGLDQLENFNHS